MKDTDCPAEPLLQGDEAAVLVRGADGALYLIPQSKLESHRVPERQSKVLKEQFTGLEGPVKTIPWPLAQKLGLVAIDWSVVIIAE